MPTYATEVALTTMICPRCAATYAINEDFRQRRQEDGKSWNCPYCECHPIYNETELDKLKKKLAAEQQRASSLSARNDQLRAEIRDTQTNAKRQITRARNERDKLATRTAAGVCPCCNRTFQQLARHMQTKHPDHAHKLLQGA